MCLCRAPCLMFVVHVSLPCALFDVCRAFNLYRALIGYCVVYCLFAVRQHIIAWLSFFLPCTTLTTKFCCTAASVFPVVTTVNKCVTSYVIVGTKVCYHQYSMLNEKC
jgi:hypothetical protein